MQRLLGPRDYTMTEATAALGQAIGKPALPYVPFPYPDAGQGIIGAGLSPSMAGLYIEMTKRINEDGLFNDEPRDAKTNTRTTQAAWAQAAGAPAFSG